MARIPNARTDSVPSVTAFDDKLFAAVRKSSDDGIELFWSENPEEQDSWHSSDLTMRFTDPPGPEEIRTSHAPALSTHNHRLWITFKGHNNSQIWQIHMRDWSYGTNGRVHGSTTSVGPAAWGGRIVYRGVNYDRSVRFRFPHIPGEGQQIPGSVTDDSPAISSLLVEDRQEIIVVWRTPDDNIAWSVTGRSGWSQADIVPGAVSSHSPSLCWHDGRLYLAYRGSDDRIWIGVFFDGVFWNILGAFSLQNTGGTPSLISFQGKLYVFCRGGNNEYVWYNEVPLQGIELTYRGLSTSRAYAHDVELGSAIYNEGRTSNNHGHAGLWLGIWGSRTGDVATGELHPRLVRSAPQENDGMPQAEGYIGYIEHGKDSSGSSNGAPSSGHDETSIIGIETLRSISWADAYQNNPQGDLCDVADCCFSTWVDRSMNRFKEKNYFGSRAPRPHVITGQDRRIAVNAAYKVFLSEPKYCWKDMLTSKNGTWQKSIEDIDELRCDGLVEVAWEYAGKEVMAGNLFGEGDADELLKAHEKIHTHPGYVTGDICPVIQGYLVSRLGHDLDEIGNDVEWSRLTTMREESPYPPYFYGTVGISEHDNCLEIMLGVADYGSDVLYITLAGVQSGRMLELLVEGDYDTTDFNNVQDIWFFRDVELTNVYGGHHTSGGGGPRVGWNNYSVIRLRWYGATIGNRERNIRDVRRCSAFQVLMVDASGHYSVYQIENPFYGAIS